MPHFGLGIVAVAIVTSSMVLRARADDFEFPLRGADLVHLVTEAGGKSYDRRATQGCPEGNVSEGYFDPCHLPDQAYYAIDVNSSKADVVAARRGTVYAVNGSGKCLSSVYWDCLVLDNGIVGQNQVFTEYREFTLSLNRATGALFRIGDVVEQGQVLGIVPGPKGSALHFQMSTQNPYNSTVKNSELANYRVGGCFLTEYRLNSDATGIPQRVDETNLTCSPAVPCTTPSPVPTSATVWKGGNYMKAVDAKDYVGAAYVASDMIRSNDISGETFMGALFLYGWGVQQDCSQALAWTRLGAALGHAPAQYEMGYFSYLGLMVVKSYADAVKWWGKSAGQGYPPAQSALAVMYFYGRGVQQDYTQSVAWSQRAAEQGFANGEDWLGYLYESGLGIAKDLTQARGWYEKAAAQGDNYAVERFAALKEVQ